MREGERMEREGGKERERERETKMKDYRDICMSKSIS